MFTKPQEPTYDDLFPALSGSKRTRQDVVIKDNNQFNVLHEDFVLDKHNISSYKDMLKKEPKIIIEEPKFASGIIDLNTYTKKNSQKDHFHSDFDFDMSKRIVPVEFDDDCLSEDSEWADTDAWY